MIKGPTYGYGSCDWVLDQVLIKCTLVRIWFEFNLPRNLPVLAPLFTGQWNLYTPNPDSIGHLFVTSHGAGTTIYLLWGFHPQMRSLWLTYIAHHHLAIASIFLVFGHTYRTNFGLSMV